MASWQHQPAAYVMTGRRRGPFYSHWCVLLEFHMKRKRLTGQGFATLIGRTQQAVHGYMVGKSRPPLELVRDWAGKLGLSALEREQFVTAAYEAWTPPQVWAKLLELETAAFGSASHVRDSDEARKLRETIGEMLVVLERVESLFYSRNYGGGVDEIHRKRSEIGLALRELIERHKEPPARPPRNGGAGGGTPK